MLTHTHTFQEAVKRKVTLMIPIASLYWHTIQGNQKHSTQNERYTGVRQADRQTGRQAGRLTDRQADRQTDRQADRQTG